MDIEGIKELIKAFSEAELSELSIKEADFELKLGKIIQGVAEVNVPARAATTQKTVQEVKKAFLNNEETAITASQEIGGKVIASPIVGTYYGASSPESKPFVEVGSKVKKGQVVCIIEAMKLMNEVEAEEDGIVAEILVQNEEMVEYGQPLFVLN